MSDPRTAARDFVRQALSQAPFNPDNDVPVMVLCRDVLDAATCAQEVEAAIRASTAQGEAICTTIARGNMASSRIAAAGCRAFAASEPGFAQDPHFAIPEDNPGEVLEPLHTTAAVYKASEEKWTHTLVAYLLSISLLIILFSLWVWSAPEKQTPPMTPTLPVSPVGDST